MELKNRITQKMDNKNIKKNPLFPKKNLLIEVTNFCNNNCIFCYNSCMKRGKKFIDKNFCKRILKEAYELGVREVGFYVVGEPLLDKRLEEFVKYSKCLGYKYIYITTNGILADLSRVKKLCISGLDSIKYSINATNQEDYLKVHGTNNFNKVLKNLNDVYEWKKANNINIKVFVSYIITKYSNCNEEEIKEMFSKMCDEIIVMPATNQGGLISNSKDIFCNLETKVKNKISLPCVYPFNSIIVTVEGYLSACCMDFENLLVYSDLNKSSLIESWTNDTIKDLRNKHIIGDVTGTICDNCVNGCSNKPKPILKQ